MNIDNSEERVPRRNRGTDCPWSPSMIASTIGYPILMGLFLSLSLIGLPKVVLVGVLVPWVALNVMFLLLWLYMIRVDPSAQGGIVVRPGQASSTHYCPICRKTVRGFDHHCQWLSTCISLRNYLPFYLLCIVGVVLYFLQTVIGLLATAYWETDSYGSSFNASLKGRSLWVISSLLDYIAGVCFSSLVGFHTYLIYKDMGTYDYVIKQYRSNNNTVH